MAQILVLTDRPQEDEHVTAFAAELAHQLEMDGLAAVVARYRHTILSTSLFLGTLDGGLLPQTMPLAVTAGSVDTVATRRLFTACHRSAAFYGLKCETGRANQSLESTAMALAGFYKLLVLSGVTLRKNFVEDVPLPIFKSDFTTPLIISPETPAPWRRVVVATQNDPSRASLITWGEYWSARLDVPLTVMELNSTPSRPAWSRFAGWLSRSSGLRHRQIIRDRLRACEIQGGDLLLVDRQPALWPLEDGPCEISVEDLIMATGWAIAVAPTDFCPEKWLGTPPLAVEYAA